jgi:hypothetical protein
MRRAAAIRANTPAPAPMPAFAPVERPEDGGEVEVGEGEEVWLTRAPLSPELVGDEVDEDGVLGCVEDDVESVTGVEVEESVVWEGGDAGVPEVADSCVLDDDGVEDGDGDGVGVGVGVGV